MAVFVLATFLFTRLDYLVNNELLYDNNLKFSDQLYSTYTMLYLLLYQLMIAVVYLQTRSLKLLGIMEAFVLTNSPDIIYFGVWNRGIFPSGDWTWLSEYKQFGHWTTLNQIELSTMWLIGTVIIVLYSVRNHLKPPQ